MLTHGLHSDILPASNAPIGVAPPGIHLPLAANHELDLISLQLLSRRSGEVYSAMPFCIRFLGPLNINALEDAINLLIERHGALRLRWFPNQLFSPVERENHLRVYARGGDFPDDLYLQSVDRGAGFALKVVDLTRHPDELRDSRFLEVAAADVQTPFDTPPRLRATLVRFGEEDHKLLVNLDHLVADGWSAGVLFSELTRFYAEATGVQSSNVLSAPLSFGDFAFWQRSRFRSGNFDTELSYWAKQWRSSGSGRIGLEELPFVSSLPKKRWMQRASKEYRLDPGSRVNVGSLMRTTRTTLQMVITAAYVTLLSSIMMREEVALWSVFANREREELQDTVGYLANKHLLGFNLARGQTVANLLEQVRCVLLDAVANQAAPLPYLWQKLGARPLAPDVALTVDTPSQASEFAKDRQVGDLRIYAEPYPEVPRIRWSPFGVSVTTAADQIVLQATYATEMFEESAVSWVLSSLARLLVGFALNPTSTVGDAAKHLVPLGWKHNDARVMNQFVVSGWNRLPAIPNKRTR